MKLDFGGEQQVAAPREQVWARLLDHEFVASCVPGLLSVDAESEHRFKAVSGFGVGPIKLRFKLDVELTDLDPPKSARMSVHGKAPGSSVQVDSSVEMEETAPGETRLTWRAVSEIRGTIASVGARLMKGAARKQVDRFWEEFAERAGGRSRGRGKGVHE